MSIRDLARSAKVATQTIVRIEAGESMRPRTIAKMAEALDIEPMAIQEYVDQRERDRQRQTATQDEPG